MARLRIGHSMTVAACLSSFASALGEADTCYGPGSVVGAVVGTSIVTVGLLVLGLFLYKMYWKNRKGKHLVLMTDAETPHDQYAFDNPCFREATPIKHGIQDEKRSSKLERMKWPGWPPVHAFGKETKNQRMSSMDDSCVHDSRLKAVTLKSHDFTGLGFSICGNMRDGIFVKDVLHRGPAFESGCISTGDRIDSVCISFRNMVFEDALSILSYASPYDVQVQVESDSHSRPSTLIRSKRESTTINSSDRILHPKFNRSQSFSHLNEIAGANNKKLSHQMSSMLEKNRINHSLNKAQDFGDLSSTKILPPGHEGRIHRNVILKISSLVEDEKSPKGGHRDRESESHQRKSPSSQNKLQKFGIKVLPISINPKMGIQSMTGSKKPGKSPTTADNEINSAKERPMKAKELSTDPSSPEERTSGLEEPDSNKEMAKGLLAKGFFNFKEKINQNTLGGRRKRGEDESPMDEETGGDGAGGEKREVEADVPVPKLRSSVTCGVKAYEKNKQNQMNVPEEVSRAGDVARNNRKSTAEARKLPASSETRGVEQAELTSGSEESSDRDSVQNETKRLKKSKGKAPAPPKHAFVISKEINEIKREDEMSIFEPKGEGEGEGKGEGGGEGGGSPRASYDSDSDSEPSAVPRDSSNMKIELNATQVTVHQSSGGDPHDDDAEPSRKAASLGDLSKLDSEQPLSVVLERAVSLDLTEGTSQTGKKRKAPLPPSEGFPAAFDDLNYRKEPRLEGLNTFQRKLKKSSDFGTLEDAICDGPKSLEVNVGRHSHLDLTETHNHNIQEFSSWLAECRRAKGGEEEAKDLEDKLRGVSTFLVNISSPDRSGEEEGGEEEQQQQLQGYQGSNVSFSVNGRNFPEFEIKGSSENVNFPGASSRTVVVISQPNSLEPAILENLPVSEAAKEGAEGGSEIRDYPEETEDGAAPPMLPSSPMPTPKTLSTPLSSTLTYITEIKVSTSGQSSERLEALGATCGSLQKETDKNHFSESSKIPIRTMKSETGQKVLATIQSLAKESSLMKTPQAEYAKRVASLFSTSHKTHPNGRNAEAPENEIPRPDPPQGLHLKAPPPKPSKDYSPTKKVPPVVPPRKMETSLSTTKSTVNLEVSPSARETPERSVVTFFSFVGGNQNEDTQTAPSKTALRMEDHGEINGRGEGL